MTVKELITALQQFPDDAIVLYEDCDYGDIEPDRAKLYYGHRGADGDDTWYIDDQPSDSYPVPCVLLD